MKFALSAAASHRTLMAIQNERYRSDTMMEAGQQEANALQAGILDSWPLFEKSR